MISLQEERGRLKCPEDAQPPLFSWNSRPCIKLSTETVQQIQLDLARPRLHGNIWMRFWINTYQNMTSKIHLEHWGQGLGMFGGINLQEIKEMVVGIQWELGLSIPPIDSSGKPRSNTLEGITFLAGNFRHPPIPALTFPMYNIDSGKPWTNKLCIQRRSVFGRRTFGPTLSKRQCDEATLNSRRAKVEELLYLGWWRWVQYPKKSVGNQQALWCACCLEFQLLRCASLSYRRWIIQNYYRGPWFGD